MSIYQEVLDLLPQRPPFLFVDKILDFNKEERTLICQKNLSFNESYFEGHFPNNPIFPGVLMIESMAQACVILLRKLNFEYDNFVLTSVDEVKIKKSVHPGDVLTIKAKLLTNKSLFFFGYGEIYNSENQFIASGRINCAGVKNK